MVGCGPLPSLGPALAADHRPSVPCALDLPCASSSSTRRSSAASAPAEALVLPGLPQLCAAPFCPPALPVFSPSSVALGMGSRTSADVKREVPAPPALALGPWAPPSIAVLSDGPARFQATGPEPTLDVRSRTTFPPVSAPVRAPSPPGPTPMELVASDDVAVGAVESALKSVDISSIEQKILLPRRVPLRGHVADAAVAAIDREHRKPRQRVPKFSKSEDRDEFKLSAEIDALIPLLPPSTVVSMLGGIRGIAQLAVAGRADFLRRRLRARCGACGERVGRMRLLLARIRKYAVVELGIPRSMCDEAVLPMSSALAHEIIHAAHSGATSRGRGSRGGRCVGHAVREDIKRAAALGWSIDVDIGSWEVAAPKAGVGGRKKAGTLPLAAKCQLEFFASGGLPEWITGAARVAAVHIVRSLLCAGIDQAVRIGEGVRVDMVPDPDAPDDIMSGVAYMGKDGAPLEIAAPAEGFLGTYEWWPEHLRNVITLGQVFPEWVRPRGSGGSVLRSGGLTRFVAEPAHIRRALKEYLELPPLSYTAAELSKMNIQGHSAHASEPEWGTSIGESPSIPDVVLSPELAVGFNDSDIDTLGNWLRSAAARSEAEVAEAARSAPPAQARRAAAVAATSGRPASRGAMRVYYGAGGALANRVGHRFKLLRARQRLVHVVQAILRGKNWRALPRGQLDLELLRSRESA